MCARVRVQHLAPCCWPPTPPPSSPRRRLTYDRAASLWQLLIALLENIPIELSRHKRRGALLWGAHQRFFRLMVMATKVGSGRDACLHVLAPCARHPSTFSPVNVPSTD